MLDDRCTHTLSLDLGAKSNSKTVNARLVVAGHALYLRLCFGEEFQDKAHWVGAICRSRAKTSPAEMPLDSPAS